MNEDDLRGRLLAQAMWTELEKIAEAGERAMKAAPGVGAVIGGVAGAANPDLFDPRTIVKKTKGSTIKGRIISGVMGAGAGATTGWLPQALKDTKDALTKKGSEKVAEVIEGPEGNPVAKIIGASVEKLDGRTAHGVPIVEPPPGFVYAPDMQAFVPDSTDPGWMTEPEAMQARETAQAYQQGMSDTQQGVAQGEADQAASQALAQQQQMMTGEQQPQPAVQQAGGPAQPTAPVIPQPKQVTGLHPMAQPDGSNVPVQPKIKQPGGKSATTVAR
tara:strand:+ start:4525 stop:5346 length:822 start_codon:yes stop_codon:yes gene_type:complete